MLDITTWPGDVDSFVDATIWLVGRMPAGPEHFCRSYTSAELDRITTARPRSSTRVGAARWVTESATHSPPSS